MCILCILIPVLVGLICALLGYLLGRLLERKSKANVKLRSDLDACRKENEQQKSLNNSLKSEVDAWSKKFDLLQSDSGADITKSGAHLAETIPFDTVLAANALGKKVVKDDLKIVEGIGPKIEELFHNAGIKTWKDLAETTVEKCQQILNDAGNRYKMHQPESWPNQSEMAYLGKWNELKEWQDSVIGGKE